MCGGSQATAGPSIRGIIRMRVSQSETVEAELGGVALMGRRGVGILAAKSGDVVLNQFAKGEGCAGVGVVFNVVDAPGAALGDESDGELAGSVLRGILRRRQREGDVGVSAIPRFHMHVDLEAPDSFPILAGADGIEVDGGRVAGTVGLDVLTE